MNTATQIGLAILMLIAVMAFILGWLAFSWNFCDKHSNMPIIGYFGVYLAPYILVGLIFLCYGLVIQPIINPPKEESAMTKEEMQKTLDKHMHDLVEHFANVDHKQVYHPETNQPGVYITHMEFVDIEGIVSMMQDLEE